MSRTLQSGFATAAVAFGVLLTFALVAPSPLSILGDAGRAAEEAVDRSLGAFFQHLVAYAIFSVLMFSGFHKERHRNVVLLVLMAHATVSELVQAFVPLREADLLDLLANAAGIGCGATLNLLISRWQRRTSKSDGIAID